MAHKLQKSQLYEFPEANKVKKRCDGVGLVVSDGEASVNQQCRDCHDLPNSARTQDPVLM